MTDFQYSFRSYDMQDLNDESKEIFDAKDKQLENYLKEQIGDITNDVTNLQTNYANLVTSTVPRIYIRAGTGVFNLPAPGVPVGIAWNSGFFDNVNIASPFPSFVSFKGIIATISNGDPPANPANLGIINLGLTGFNAYHISNGNIGAPCRFNVFAYAYEI